MFSLPLSFSRVSRAPFAQAGHALDRAFATKLSALYERTRTSTAVFASPLGHFDAEAGSAYVPRFVYCEPSAGAGVQRLAFYAGFDASDLRASSALLGFTSWLADASHLARGLELSFFPLVDALGAFQGVRDRNLAKSPWSTTDVPELALLEKDARAAGYNGAIRVETAPPGEDEVVIRVRSLANPAVRVADVELISSEEIEPLAARFEIDVTGRTAYDGPLSLAEDLPFAPFEITLGLPTTWTDAVHHAAVRTILQRFLRRYRGLHAYAPNL